MTAYFCKKKCRGKKPENNATVYLHGVEANRMESMKREETSLNMAYCVVGFFWKCIHFYIFKKLNQQNGLVEITKTEGKQKQSQEYFI